MAMSTCAFCHSRTVPILDYGNVALAGAFLKKEQFADEKKYPLSLHFCEECFAAQIPERVPRAEMFSNYFYFSSATSTMRKHFSGYAKRIVERFRPANAVEIGCNDGALLGALADLGVKTTGIDPAANVVSGIRDHRIRVIADYFSEQTALEAGPTDIVIANNVFAHIADIHEATRAISNLLSDDGVFVFEVNKLASLIADLQYDWVYHEHLFYYSTLTLQKHLANYGLEIFDVENIATHGGSARYYACKTGRRPLAKSVEMQVAREIWLSLDRVERFHIFAQQAKAHRDAMREFMDRHAGKRVVGYGACGRSSTMIQFCDIALDYIVDDAPAKHGHYMPGSHVPIVSSRALDDDKPDAVIVFAWSFLPEISAKAGGHNLIVPLPYIRAFPEMAAA